MTHDPHSRADVCVVPSTAPPGRPTRGHGWYAVHTLNPATGGLDRLIGWLAQVTPATVTCASWWQAADAGPGIPIDQTVRHPGQDEALNAVLTARTDHAEWFTPGPDGLSEFERQALQAERFIPAMRSMLGGRDQAIRDLFNMSPTVYTYKLLSLIHGPRRAHALAYDFALADAAKSGTGIIYALERRMDRNRQRKHDLPGYVRGDPPPMDPAHMYAGQEEL